MNQNSSVRKLARCAVVAAIYVVLCMALQPFSYGAVQVRVAEALCLLPVFGPEYIAGVVLGCFLANLLGSTIVDVIFGTLATLLACLVTYKLRDLRFKGLALAASLPPVLFNAVIIGIEIAVLFPDPSSSAPLWLACITNGISVGIGELISCTVLGVLLVKIIETNAALRKVLLIEQQARHCFEKGLVLLLGLYQKTSHVRTEWCRHGTFCIYNLGHLVFIKFRSFRTPHRYLSRAFFTYQLVAFL